MRRFRVAFLAAVAIAVAGLVEFALSGLGLL